MRPISVAATLLIVAARIASVVSPEGDGLVAGTPCAAADSMCGVGACDELGTCVVSAPICFRRVADVSVLWGFVVAVVSVPALAGVLTLLGWLTSRVLSR